MALKVGGKTAQDVARSWLTVEGLRRDWERGEELIQDLIELETFQAGLDRIRPEDAADWEQEIDLFYTQCGKVSRYVGVLTDDELRSVHPYAPLGAMGLHQLRQEWSQTTADEAIAMQAARSDEGRF